MMTQNKMNGTHKKGPPKTGSPLYQIV